MDRSPCRRASVGAKRSGSTAREASRVLETGSGGTAMQNAERPHGEVLGRARPRGRPERWQRPSLEPRTTSMQNADVVAAGAQAVRRPTGRRFPANAVRGYHPHHEGRWSSRSTESWPSHAPRRSTRHISSVRLNWLSELHCIVLYGSNCRSSAAEIDACNPSRTGVTQVMLMPYFGVRSTPAARPTWVASIGT